MAETHIKLSKTEILKNWALGSHIVKLIQIVGFHRNYNKYNKLGTGERVAETHIKLSEREISKNWAKGSHRMKLIQIARFQFRKCNQSDWPEPMLNNDR